MLHRGYTRTVSATQIAENLAFINWTVLTGLALGSFAAVVLLARGTTATSGYLRFTTICALAFGALAWLSDGALPTNLASAEILARCASARLKHVVAAHLSRENNRPDLARAALAACFGGEGEAIVVADPLAGFEWLQLD